VRTGPNTDFGYPALDPSCSFSVLAAKSENITCDPGVHIFSKKSRSRVSDIKFGINRAQILGDMASGFCIPCVVRRRHLPLHSLRFVILLLKKGYNLCEVLACSTTFFQLYSVLLSYIFLTEVIPVCINKFV